ncbi:ATP-binding cassette domain-containing protein [Streptomyces sp. C3-3]|uniref:ATP-binding cassette domain-containing protein n=1 Tax=Streptomyces sp. C3-3 TaxID=2824901 RepID=UPI002493D96D|nr:ATP-binding cassette domain-containing protein [Streptomyces sp. C3-3]
MTSSFDGPVLDVRNLRVAYGGDGRSVLGADDVSFSIGPGEVFGLAGESGCGKSTVANAIMRLLKPPRGHHRFRELQGPRRPRHGPP